MIAIASLLVTLTLSLLVTRFATMALILTGLSRESAQFQARSAFSGVGFTTSESEAVLGHPVRRRIVMTLMLLGNVGIATVVATVMVSFINTQQNAQWVLNLSLLSLGLLMLWMLSKSRWIERRLNKVIAWSLKRFTHLDVRDYVALLNLQHGYAVSEMKIVAGDWLADKSLIELGLPKEGVLVLGIERAGVYVGAPTGDTVLHIDDTLVLYGPIDRIEELNHRQAGRKGDVAHQEAISEHQDAVCEEQELIASADNDAA